MLEWRNGYFSRRRALNDNLNEIGKGTQRQGHASGSRHRHLGPISNDHKLARAMLHLKILRRPATAQPGASRPAIDTAEGGAIPRGTQDSSAGADVTRKPQLTLAQALINLAQGRTSRRASRSGPKVRYKGRARVVAIVAEQRA